MNNCLFEKAVVDNMMAEPQVENVSKEALLPLVLQVG